MSKIGSSVRLAINATAIARPVSNPKYIVGIKLDRANIEKPIMTVMDV
jgi:hypothetical protein